MAIQVEGNWKKGFAFDVHTLSSTYLGPDDNGHDQWDNTRSEMGELVYQLKYRRDQSALQKIIELLDGKMKGIAKFDYIVPIPPTDTSRQFQPVTEIALALGKAYDVDVLVDLLRKNSGGRQIKNVSDIEERQQLLREALSIKSEHQIAGCDILLVDDLYRSGATLNVATDLLYRAEAGKVCVLTMTKTRSNR
ncbi:MAG: ComF family protein [Alphaproteobacteria bacterium GM202ARS2]|nr:ComF family protein [Alphaproteobacteria bacterium GM202ARS2]